MHETTTEPSTHETTAQPSMQEATIRRSKVASLCAALCQLIDRWLPGKRRMPSNSLMQAPSKGRRPKPPGG